jgi:hypothetical protein
MKLYRNGTVHVLSEQCATCIFRPGNLMRLKRGRVKEMIEEAHRNTSCIICHETLGTRKGAVCRGFFDRHPTLPLQIAERMDLITWQEPKR